MPQSFGVYGGQSQGVQPWSQTITLFPGSQNVSNFFSLYNSQGSPTFVGANTIATLLDGPEKVVRYDDLVLGDGTAATSLTASNRCKSLVILCNTLRVKNNATLNMTGKGPRVERNDDPYYPFVDFKMPFSVNLSSSVVSLANALAVIKAQGLAPWDFGTFATIVSGLYGFSVSTNTPGSLALVSGSALGNGAATKYNGASWVVGNTGGAGANGAGGGGGGGCAYTCEAAQGGYGNPYGGGSGSGGNIDTAAGTSCPIPPSKYSGYGGSAGGTGSNSPALFVFPGDASTYATYGHGGGGAGNPGGKKGINASDTSGSDGVGGKLIIIAKTSITVDSGGKIECNGMPGGYGAAGPGGGGSGGGILITITPSLTNNGTLQCLGGLGGPGGGAAGGPGGMGSVVPNKLFTDMGW